jgi:streptomycin 3"-adenylyltransferase
LELCEILSAIAEAYKAVLGDNMVGIYVHGSIAFGCFRFSKSDIDFLAVVKDRPSQAQKEALIGTLLRLHPVAPPKGFEMSVVLLENCRRFVYPTPFELHFSNTHLKRAKEDLAEYCRTMNGVDHDLAAHFTVVKQVGVPLCGSPVEDVFGDVPKEAYLSSIQADVRDAESEIHRDPVYVILNLCRVLAYRKSDLVLSKEQGGLWGTAHLPGCFVPIVQEALNCYGSEKEMSIAPGAGVEFASYMKKAIFED